VYRIQKKSSAKYTTGCVSGILRSSDISGYHSGAATDTSLLPRHAVHEDEGTSNFETSWTIYPTTNLHVQQHLTLLQRDGRRSCERFSDTIEFRTKLSLAKERERKFIWGHLKSTWPLCAVFNIRRKDKWHLFQECPKFTWHLAQYDIHIYIRMEPLKTAIYQCRKLGIYKQRKDNVS